MTEFWKPGCSSLTLCISAFSSALFSMQVRPFTQHHARMTLSYLGPVQSGSYFSLPKESAIANITAKVKFDIGFQIKKQTTNYVIAKKN